MPERPKRRKNNKNKRKNKNSKPDGNKNISDVNNVDMNNGETCDNDNVENLPETDDVSTEVAAETISSHSEVIINTEECLNAEVSLSNVHSPNGDWNNNSNQVINESASSSELKKPEDVDFTDSVAYTVESPDQSLEKNKTKLKNIKSKSLDNEDTTNIVEITDNTVQFEGNNNLPLIDSQDLIVSLVESDPEWEKTDELKDIYTPQSQEVATGTLSVTTIPLAQCNVALSEQQKSLTPDEEKSLRSYLKTLNLVTEPENINAIEIKTEIEQIINQEIKQRLRKKGLADDFFLHRLGPPRVLDVIDEEGSSESSMTSRRQSYLSDKKSDVEDLEDDVFENSKNKVIQRKLLSSNTSVHKKSIGQLVPQECVLVGAKLKEPEVTEARGEWTMKTVEKMTGAEIVYLTDTSSSSSSLHEIGDDDDDGVDTDVSVRMMTPTIEVTDPENFLKKTFVVAAQSVKENELAKTLQNDTYNNAHEEKHPNLKKNNIEHVIKIEYADDKNSAEMEKIVTKTESECNLQQQLEDICTPINKKLHVNESAGSEKIINIEIEKPGNVENSDLGNLHEIVVLSTDDIKTNLYVKDINPVKHNKQDVETLKANEETSVINITNQTNQSKYDLETKIIKCEFNDAINNLIKEVTSDPEGAEESPKDVFTRQDSSSSVDSSQCTAKYNPNYESLNDISNILHDENSNKLVAEQISTATSHVKDVFDCVTGTATQHKGKVNERRTEHPLRLKDICVRKIASLPYGDKILEELASVSQRLQNFTSKGSISETVKDQDQVNRMPHYRLPDVSTIEKISLPTKVKDSVPPPIQPRHSSLKKSQDDEHWTGVQTSSEPVYVCLSPSQKMLMDKTNTVITKEDASHLVDLHTKFVARRGYSECYKNEKPREEYLNSPPIVPFKSQTGSRLLALIRDPCLTRNINSLNDRLNNSLDELQIKRMTRKTFTNDKEDEIRCTQNFSFKPIPPPRPKKYSNSFYESDESSDFTDNSMRSMKSERKIFHYSTGNLNKDIEDDVSTIQNMHRYYMEKKDVLNDRKYPRRPSLPKDLCEQQMEYIRRKEKEVEAEIQRLEALKSTTTSTQRNGPRAPIVSEKDITTENTKYSNTYFISHKKDPSINSQNHEVKKGKMSSLFSSSQEELLREKMYSEYVTQMAEREERKQHKVIKITKCPAAVNSKISKSMSAIDAFDSKVNNRIEKEFISRARERWDKLGIKDPETEDERESARDVYKEPKVIEHKIKVIEGGKEKDVKKLPTHLQEFVGFTAKDKEHSAGGSGESKAGPVAPHLVILSAVIVIVIAVGKYFFRLLRYN